jgi:hypothetical protein
MNIMTPEYTYWNDTAVAHMFMRLITKTNNPYNDTPLSLDEFNKEYNLLRDYIEWRKHNVKKGFSLYNFTYENMMSLLHLMNYHINNKDELLKIWNTTIIGVEQL